MGLAAGHTLMTRGFFAAAAEPGQATPGMSAATRSAETASMALGVSNPEAIVTPDERRFSI
ncbi:MAG: hypothetical protein E4H11_02265 [Myxococcales bacterium]|nr:MAG: hypothetical protein E4H11_02265 [Myxococcales bacterium]